MGQVPLPFVVDRKTTYEVDIPKAQKKGHKVWVSQPGNGLDKRQCSNDAKVNPEGLHDYVVPKTLPVQVPEEAIECPVPDAAPEPDDVVVNDDDRFEAENV